MRDQARVLRAVAAAAFVEHLSVFSWREWALSWLTRLLIQVSFFGLIGRMLGSEQQTEYLIIGNAIAIVALEALSAILVIVMERRSGNLELLVAAPASHLTVYLGRGVHFLGSGIVTSTIMFLTLPTVFGLPVRWSSAALVPLVIVVIGVAAYGYSACLASFVVRFPGSRWLVLNVSYSLLTVFCGVNVPVDYWPAAARWVAEVLPLTHGLQAIRILLADGPGTEVLLWTLGELAVAALWFTIAAARFHRMVGRGRADGSIVLQQ
jgi:ABC-2 type transport system permease protein